MNHREPVLPVKLMLMLAWATLVGLAGGAGITLALTDTASADRVRQAFLACPAQQPAQQETNLEAQ